MLMIVALTVELVEVVVLARHNKQNVEDQNEVNDDDLDEKRAPLPMVFEVLAVSHQTEQAPKNQ